VLATLLSTGPRIHSAGFSSGFSPWTYLLNQPPILLRYLTLVVWPRSLVVLYGLPEALTLASVWPSAVVIAGLLALTIVAFRSRPQLAFLGAWVWITLAPTSSIVPIATEVGAERRMYLPLAALVLLAVIAVTTLWDRWNPQVTGPVRFGRVAHMAAPALLVMVSAALAAATVVRNQDYGSAMSLAQLSLERYPTPVAHHMLGVALLNAGRRDEAFVQLRQALPGTPRAHFTLGDALLETGDTNEGLAELRAFVNEVPSYLSEVVTAHELMGNTFARQGRWAEAINEFQAILQVLPNDPKAELYIGDALFSDGRANESIPYYQAYLSHAPRDPNAWNSLGMAMGSSGRLTDAAAAFRAALRIDSESGPAERNLASALSALRDWDGSLAHAERAVALQPSDAGSHDVLGRALAAKGRFDEAKEQFVRAVSLDPDLIDARQDLERIEQSLRP
jgi:tetratricopeptide (TPR) repeat protein